MNVILAADIFGIKDYLYQLTEHLVSAGFKPTIVSPYPINTAPFTDEKSAYHHFSTSTSVEDYSNKLNDTLNTTKQPTAIVGFSAGAAAAYLLTDKNTSQLNYVMGFYGGQIRHHSSLNPQCTCDLIQAQSEDHFDVNKLNEQLLKHASINLTSANFGHGFMNPHSKNYNEQGALHWQKEIVTRLMNHANSVA